MLYAEVESREGYITQFSVTELPLVLSMNLRVLNSCRSVFETLSKIFILALLEGLEQLQDFSVLSQFIPKVYERALLHPVPITRIVLGVCPLKRATTALCFNDYQFAVKNGYKIKSSRTFLPQRKNIRTHPHQDTLCDLFGKYFSVPRLILIITEIRHCYEQALDFSDI